MKDIVDHTLDSMKVQFRKRGASVKFEAKGEDFSMDADKLHIAGVVYNLVDNALKYSPDSPALRISLVQQNGSMVFEIADSGIGISKQDQQRIFEKFFRVPAGDAHNVKGHGLGLSYVSHVVHAHHGTITVESEPGDGAHFKVTLPKHHGH